MAQERKLEKESRRKIVPGHFSPIRVIPIHLPLDGLPIYRQQPSTTDNNRQQPTTTVNNRQQPTTNL